MHLFEQHEGYGVQRYDANLVAGQQEYVLPEEAAKIRTVFIRDSGGAYKRAIQQDRQYTGGYLGDDTQASSNQFSYQMLDNHMFLYPAPSESVTNGIQYHLETASDRIANDSDKLPDSWPPFVETLLIYDTAISALSQQATAEGDLGESQIQWLIRVRRPYEELWDEYTASRTTSLVCSQGWNQGA